MKPTKRISGVPIGLILALMMGWMGIGFGGDFEIEVLSWPTELIPGVIAEIRAEARNVSGHPITVAWEGRDLKIEVLQEDGTRVVPCRSLHFTGEITPRPADWEGRVLEADWSTDGLRGLCFDSPGKYTIRFFIESHGPYRNRNGEEFEAWEGEVSTRPLTVVVRELEGVDREVFEAYDGNLRMFEAGGERPGDILRRFPTSTYAAYVVWVRTDAKGRAASDPEAVAKALDWELSQGSMQVPCDIPDLCAQDGHMRLSRMEFIRWSTQWKRLVLEHHPKIWFADELRFALACDLYQLGDKAGCASQLDILSENGLPYIAQKARDLVGAMSSRGLLPEKDK